MRISFIYFLEKNAPVSKIISQIDYKVEILIESNKEQNIFSTKVEVPITTLCPCSKEISNFGAHNQRATVVLSVSSGCFILPDFLINLIEKNASGELYSVLKRVDEKAVTEKMYNNPMFVEDVVRQLAVQVKNDKRFLNYNIECISNESIHNHNAFAEVKKGI